MSKVTALISYYRRDPHLQRLLRDLAEIDPKPRAMQMSRSSGRMSSKMRPG